MSLEDFAGFGLGGYRSFGSAEVQFVGPMEKVHLLIGRNNVGKSNVLHFAHDCLQILRQSPHQTSSNLYTGQLDLPQGWDTSRPRVLSLGIRLTDSANSQYFAAAVEPIAPLLRASAFTRGFDDTLWFEFEVDEGGQVRPGREQFERGLAETTGTLSHNDLSVVSTRLTQTSGDALSNYTNIVNKWAPWAVIPEMHWVDTNRRITNDPNNSGLGTRNGTGLINALAALQNPDHATYSADTAKWSNLNQFIQAVLDDPSARVQIPNSQSTILVATGDSAPMPLGSLGTGIEELIILAAVATINSDRLICVEEPELHLHPTLQRMLIQFLYGSTSNRYLISTHSASLVNAELASMTHLSKRGGHTFAERVIDSQTLSLVVKDLGNRASDLVQSNFVIWVEGPSDRLYVRAWLQEYAPELLEGAHFSIMFYGGALLSHLSADDQETDDFIHLLRINRNLAVVIDSDKQSADAELNETKRRVIHEAESVDGMAWVTEGYTVENYIPRHDLAAAIRVLYPSKEYTVPASQWRSPLGKAFKGNATRPSKVMVAQTVVGNGVPKDTWSTHLLEQIAELAKRIRQANGMAE